MSLNCEEINQIIEKIPAAMMIRKVTEEEYGCFYLYCMAPDESSVILQIVTFNTRHNVTSLGFMSTNIYLLTFYSSFRLFSIFLYAI